MCSDGAQNQTLSGLRSPAPTPGAGTTAPVSLLQTVMGTLLSSDDSRCGLGMAPRGPKKCSGRCRPHPAPPGFSPSPVSLKWGHVTAAPFLEGTAPASRL